MKTSTPNESANWLLMNVLLPLSVTSNVLLKNISGSFMKTGLPMSVPGILQTNCDPTITCIYVLFCVLFLKYT